MLPMLIVQKKMNTIKQPGKGDNAYQRSSTSHNFFKIVIQKMLLKMFSTLTCITTQLRRTLKKALMPKGMI
jgi:hypothetical protein